MENLFVSKLKETIVGRAVIFIDAANLEQSVKEMKVAPSNSSGIITESDADKFRWSVDYRKLYEFFTILGTEDIRFYTADFKTQSHINFLYFLSKELGFKLIAKPLKKYHNHIPNGPHYKANFDVEIAVDAVSAMLEFDTLVLFSGDCDFEYLIKYLRSNKKIVIGLSYFRNASTELQLVVNQYFDIENFKDEFLRITSKTGKASSPATRDL